MGQSPVISASTIRMSKSTATAVRSTTVVVFLRGSSARLDAASLLAGWENVRKSGFRSQDNRRFGGIRSEHEMNDAYLERLEARFGDGCVGCFW
jgi:hypothetical protein